MDAIAQEQRSDQFFPKKAKLSESFSCTYSFQILCLEFQTPVFGIPIVVQRCLEFQTSVFGIPNIMHSCVFGIPNMHVYLEFQICGISCTFRSSPDPETSRHQQSIIKRDFWITGNTTENSTLAIRLVLWIVYWS